MPRTEQNIRNFIKKYPDEFSLQSLFVQKAPTRCLHGLRIAFCLSIILLMVAIGYPNIYIRYHFILLTLTFSLEIVYLVYYAYWTIHNPNFYKAMVITYFLKNGILNKNDYIIMEQKINNTTISYSYDKNIKIISNIGKIGSAILLPLIPTFIKYYDKIPISSIFDKFGSRILALLLIILIIFVSIFFYISNYKSKKNDCTRFLRQYMDTLFFKNNGKLNMDLIDDIFANQKSIIARSLQEKYRLQKPKK